MKYPIQYTAIMIMRASAPCCNHCRFCSAGVKAFHNIPFPRYEAFVERFIAWREGHNPAEFIVIPFQLHTCVTMPLKQVVRRLRLCERGGYRPLPLQMNGLIFMPDDELYDCLAEKKEAGYRQINLSFAGMEKFHDIWVGRRGEYEFLLRIARISADLGLERIEKLFLAKSTIPQLEHLMTVLDNIPGSALREIQPLSYTGLARNLEEERITRELVEGLPERVLRYAVVQGLKTEKEWIAWLSDAYREPSVDKKTVFLRLREQDFAALETRSCDEIMDDLKSRYAQVHACLPGLNELSEMYGDTSNMRLYARGELERKWSQRYLKDHPEISKENYLIANVI